MFLRPWKAGVEPRLLLGSVRTLRITRPSCTFTTRRSVLFSSRPPPLPRQPFSSFVSIPRKHTRWGTEKATRSGPGQRRHYIDWNDPRIRNARPFFSNEGLRRFGRSGSTWTVVATAFLAAVIFYFSNLETVPVSGRTRFNCFSREYIKKMSAQEHGRLLHDLQSQGKPILGSWDSRTRKVKRVLAKLIPFSGMVDEEWEVFVIDDPQTVNAFVLPGGKVFVHTGILHVARSDAALAAVLGHEVAHLLAGHTGERLSQNIGANILLYSLVLLTAPFNGAPYVMQVLGHSLLDVVFGRPMTRRQETEADYVGLMIMAEACYDPRAAVEFWQTMSRLQEVPPEWLSTHPSHTSRVKNVQEWLPEAMDKWAQSDCATTTSFADLFQRAMRGDVVMRPVL